ncbi:hypothetical protein [Paracoccus zeaxanthinifaciens]|uniref:COG3904 family protein n=1 Tax=Paracoccus zeaxanthinifaciens TaxID=187400 RepID=UPI0003B3DC58|nr:hypothetical protein [Paracoccus zeaxanthinifaciens]
MRLFSSPQSAIRSVLIAQVVLGVAIVAIDLRDDPGNAAPGLFTPQEGPSVRPYRPDLRPAEPGAPAMRPMPKQLEFSETDDAIVIEGQIAVGDADRFAEWLDETRPAASEVSLDSSGGSVADALAIGRTIRGAGYDTRIAQGSVCMSACPYMLAGGTERRADEGSTVGVHQHYFGKNAILPAFMAVSDVQRAQASVMDYLTEMGVDLRMMIPALRTAPEDISVLSPQQMQEWSLTFAPDA